MGGKKIPPLFDKKTTKEDLLKELKKIKRMATENLLKSKRLLDEVLKLAKDVKRIDELINELDPETCPDEPHR